MSVFGSHRPFLPVAEPDTVESELARIFQLLSAAPEGLPRRHARSALFDRRRAPAIDPYSLASVRISPPAPPPTVREMPSPEEPRALSAPVRRPSIAALPHIYGVREFAPLAPTRFGRIAHRTNAAVAEFQPPGAARPAPADTKPSPRTYPAQPLLTPSAPRRPSPAPQPSFTTVAPVVRRVAPALPPTMPPVPMPPAPPPAAPTMVQAAAQAAVDQLPPAAPAVPTPSVAEGRPVPGLIVDTIPAPLSEPRLTLRPTIVRPPERKAPEPSRTEAEVAAAAAPLPAVLLPAAPLTAASLPAAPLPAAAVTVLVPPPAPLPPPVPPVAGASLPLELPLPAAVPVAELPPPALPPSALPPSALPLVAQPVPAPSRPVAEDAAAPDQPLQLTTRRMSQERTHRSRVVRNVALATTALLLPGAALLYYAMGSRAQPGPAAVVDAPFVSVRAPVDGQLTEVRATEGQAVEPDTVLFVVQPAAPVASAPAAAPAPSAPAAVPPRMGATEARTLLDAINIQITAAENAALPRGATGSQIVARMAQLADLRRQRDAAERAVQAAQDFPAPVAAAPAPAAVPAPAQSPSAPTAVKAGVNGLLWSVLTPRNAPVASGTPLARVADCERLFLAVPTGGTVLRPGQDIELRFDQGPAIRARVRAAAPDTSATNGTGQAPGRILIDAATSDIRNATGDRCPVGKSAQVLFRG